jgi:hypothetical protein
MPGRSAAVARHALVDGGLSGCSGDALGATLRWGVADALLFWQLDWVAIHACMAAVSSFGGFDVQRWLDVVSSWVDHTRTF